jgi:hypothetical protein
MGARENLSRKPPFKKPEIRRIFLKNIWWFDWPALSLRSLLKKEGNKVP